MEKIFPRADNMDRFVEIDMAGPEGTTETVFISEQDLKAVYVGLGGFTLTFTDKTFFTACKDWLRNQIFDEKDRATLTGELNTLPPNLRDDAKCCANCKHHDIDRGEWVCKEYGQMTKPSYICDGFDYEER